MFSEKRAWVLFIPLWRCFQGLLKKTQSNIKIDVIVVKKHVFLKLIKKYVRLRLKWKKTGNVIITILIEYAWINRILKMSWGLNMTKFLTRLNSVYCRVLDMRALYSVLNMPEYILTEFWIYLGFKICQYSEYGRALRASITQGSKYAIIWLNVWIYYNRQSSEYVSNNT